MNEMNVLAKPSDQQQSAILQSCKGLSYLQTLLPCVNVHGSQFICNWVAVDIDNYIQILRDNLDDTMQTLAVKVGPSRLRIDRSQGASI